MTVIFTTVLETIAVTFPLNVQDVLSAFLILKIEPTARPAVLETVSEGSHCV